MKWQRLMTDERLADKGYAAGPDRSIFVQDYDRIVFSAPFRRLANKTQVHPLYHHDHLHHRLIHSIEVASVGRSLAMRIGRWLAECDQIPRGAEHDLANIVMAACAAHDIGNPPFGHSGEEAIGDWFAAGFDRGRGLLADLDPSLRPEFTAFEGNAQGFRILTRLEMYRGTGGMRLSLATLGAFMKYPVTAATREALPEATRAGYAGLKKFGLFAGDLPAFERAAEALGLPCEGAWWRRHPLVLVVEAADDIAYNIVDLEDAFTAGLLPFEVVRDALYDLAGRPNRDTAGMTPAEQIAMLRAIAIGSAVEACFNAFVDHYDAIMDGLFPASLVEASGRATEIRRLKEIATQIIFTSQRKTELEVAGRQVLHRVLDAVLPVLEDLARHGWQADALPGGSARVARALALDLRDVTDPDSALHAMADFVSGMTDRYALSTAKLLNGTA